MSASYGSCKDSLPVLESVDASARLIIDLKALAANYGTLCKATNADVAGVVKANAYGLGLRVVAKVPTRDRAARLFLLRSLARERHCGRCYLPRRSMYSRH